MSNSYLSYFSSRVSPSLFRAVVVTVTAIVMILQLRETLSLFTSPTDENLFRDSPFGVEVIDVLRGGASERAGMRIGDVIVAINGITFETASEANQILRQSKPDEILVYTVQRGASLLNLYVQIAKVGIDWSLLLLLVIALGTASIGLFVGWLRPDDFGARLLSLALILFSNIYVPVLSNSADSRLLLEAAWILSSPLFLHVRLYVPKQSRFHSTLKRYVQEYYAISLIFFAFISLDFAPNLVTDSTLVFWLKIAVVGVYVSLNPYYWYRFTSTVEPEHNTVFKQIGIALLIFLVALIGGSILSAINKNGRFVFLLLGAVPITFYYTILKYRLFGITRLVRRSLRHLLASIGLIMLSIWALVNLVAFLIKLSIGGYGVRFTAFSIQGYPAPIGSLAELEGQRFFFLSIGIAVGILYWIVIRKLKFTLDKEFHQEDYDYRSALSELSQIFAERLKVNPLGEALADETIKLMSLKGMAIYLTSRDSYQCVVARGSLTRVTEVASERVFASFNMVNSLTIYEPKEGFDAFNEGGVQLLVPLLIKERQVGLMVLAEKLSEDSYKRDDLEFIDSVSKQAAVALENARLSEEDADRRRLKRELEFARKVQKELLPEALPNIPGLDISGSYVAAGEVGGDYYDVVEGSNGRLTLLVGDVSGKGISAAMTMARVQGIVRTILSEHGFSPKGLLEKINTAIFSKQSRGTFVTMLCAEVVPNDSLLRLARAGHLPMLYVSHATLSTTWIKPGGMGIGMTTERLFSESLEEVSITYLSGDCFVFISDGVTEAKSESGEEFGTERLEQAVLAAHHQSAEDITQAVQNALIDFVGDAEQYDDVTVVVIKCH